MFLRNEKINLKVIILSFLSPGKKYWEHKMMRRPNFNYYNHTYYDLIEKTEILYLSFCLTGVQYSGFPFLWYGRDLFISHI